DALFPHPPIRVGRPFAGDAFLAHPPIRVGRPSPGDAFFPHPPIRVGRPSAGVVFLAHTLIRVGRHYARFKSEKKGKKPRERRLPAIGACARDSRIACATGQQLTVSEQDSGNRR
ncbi:hypothetical protein AVEN_182111-1, partial [Araneus ventricosus]